MYASTTASSRVSQSKAVRAGSKALLLPPKAMLSMSLLGFF
jgi:hypothetical protein